MLLDRVFYSWRVERWNLTLYTPLSFSEEYSINNEYDMNKRKREKEALHFEVESNIKLRRYGSLTDVLPSFTCKMHTLSYAHITGFHVWVCTLVLECLSKSWKVWSLFNMRILSCGILTFCIEYWYWYYFCCYCYCCHLHVAGCYSRHPHRTSVAVSTVGFGSSCRYIITNLEGEKSQSNKYDFPFLES